VSRQSRCRFDLVAPGLRSALVAIITVAGTAGAAEPPPCFASASLDPDNAVEGEPVLYRVRIARRADAINAVLDPPSFAALRAEWLEGPTEIAELHDGFDYRVREERIALVAGTPLRLTLGPAVVRCTTLRDGVRQTFDAPVAETNLTISALPEKGRPAEFSGLVGAPTLIVTVTPQSVALGESIRVAVLMRGSGNLWEARDPLPALDDAEIFRQRPVLRVQRGRTLSVARHFIYDVVPRKQGQLVIPKIVVPYFDPSTNTYDEARADGTSVDVTPRRTQHQTGEPSAR